MFVHGLSCPSCSDGISFPEKFVSNMLNQLEISYLYDCSFSWFNNKRYDFYLEDYSLIIETHGGQHYINGFTKYGKLNIDLQRKNDKEKRNIAKYNGIKNYIELDCRFSNKEHIKSSIIQSELSKMFDLSKINFDVCNKFASENSRIIDVCNLWNQGKQTRYISNVLGLTIYTVIKYLKIGNDIKLCNYDAKENIKLLNSKKVLCIETNKIYSKIKDVTIDGFNPKCVSNCCTGYQVTHKGFHFEYY